MQATFEKFLRDFSKVVRVPFPYTTLKCSEKSLESLRGVWKRHFYMWCMETPFLYVSLRGVWKRYVHVWGMEERWGAGVETQKNVRGEIGGWGRVPFNETYAPSLSTIYDGA